MRLESKAEESLLWFVISPSVAVMATAPSSKGASETFCVLYHILFRQSGSPVFRSVFCLPLVKGGAEARGGGIALNERPKGEPLILITL